MAVLPPLLERGGRKLAHVAAIVPTLVSWATFYCARSAAALLAAVLLQGASYSGCTTLGPVVIGELCFPKYRGVFQTLTSISVLVGILIVHVLGMYTHWRTVALVLELPPLLALFITLTWKESPYWLAARGKFDQCAESFHWYRGYDEESIAELKNLVTEQRAKLLERSEKSNENIDICSRMCAVLRQFRQRDFLRPLGVLLVANSFFDLGGRSVLVTYSITIFKDIGLSDSEASLATLAMDALMLVALGACCALTRVMRRRAQLLLSAGAGAACAALAALSVRLRTAGVLPAERAWPAWLSAALLVGYAFGMSLGSGALALGLTGELFPLRHKALGVATVAAYISLMQLLVVKLAPSLMALAGVDGEFLAHAVAIAVAIAILYFHLPETKGKTLLEIEQSVNAPRASAAPAAPERHVLLLAAENGQ